jgi:hypothetical protein
VDTATAPAVRQNGSHKKRPPNGLNVTFPNFVHLPTVLLNQSALKDYLMGALKVCAWILNVCIPKEKGTHYHLLDHR